MSAVTTFPLMSIEEFEALPEPKGNFTYELHFGKLVKVGRPSKGHFLLQCLIRNLLIKAIGTQQWLIEIEVAYNLASGYDARSADVAVVSRKKYDEVPFDGCLTIAPELIVFVKSRSNRDTQIDRDAIDCLTHGAEAAWYVKYNPDVVYVYTAEGKKEYRSGQVISLPGSMGGRVAVKDIFKDLRK